MRGWGEPYRASFELGLRQLGRRTHLREAIVRLVVPMDPSRYLEIPWAEHAFDEVFNGPSSQLALFYTERFIAAVTR